MTRTLTICLKGNQFRVYDPEGGCVEYVDELRINDKIIEANEFDVNIPAEAFEKVENSVVVSTARKRTPVVGKVRV